MFSIRKVFKLTGCSFEECEMKDLKKGDKFKLFEKDGRNVTDKYGNDIFTAKSDARRFNGITYRVDIE